MTTLETVTGGRTRRLIGFDVACALAVFGMVIVNFKIAMGAETAGPPWLVWLVGPLTSTGQLALTLYVAHVVVGMGALEVMGRLENQSLPMALGSALLFCAAGLAFAAVWRRFFRRGPLEWVLRRLTA